MNTSSLFYEPSENINPLGLVFTYVVGIAITSLLAYLYNLIVQFSPIIYVNLLVTIGFGLTLGFLVRMLTRLSHNRSIRHQLFLAIVLGLWANYGQWVGFLMYAITGVLPGLGEYFSNLGIILADPVNTFGFIAQINRIGMWEVFGLPFRGITLTLIWLVEMGIIIAFPLIAVFKARPIPYAEDLKTWYPKYALIPKFEAIIGPERFVERLRENPLLAIQELEPGVAWKYSKFYLHYLPEAKHQYLSVEKVYLEDRGRGKKEVTNLIDNFRLDRQTAKTILDNFSHKKDRWDW